MSQAFGADLSGSNFDFKAFLTKPSVIVRIVSIIFAIIVFGCIGNGGNIFNKCVYNGDSNACNYGIAMGVIAFIVALTFLVGETVFHQISNVDHRKYIVMADIGFSGFWSFMWFVGFCYLTNRLSNTTLEPTIPLNDARGAIAFSFFSIFTWAAQCFLAVRQYRAGVGELFASSDDVLDHGSGFAGSGVGSSTIPEPVGRAGAGGYDDQMIGGDLAGGYQQQQPPTQSQY